MLEAWHDGQTRHIVLSIPPFGLANQKSMTLTTWVYVRRQTRSYFQAQHIPVSYELSKAGLLLPKQVLETDL